MLDIKYIRENVDTVKENCKNRRLNVDIDQLLKLDEERRDLQQQADELRALRNQKSKGKPTPEEIEKMKKVGEEIKEIEGKLKEVVEAYTEILLQVPNITHPDVPVGGEEDFKTIEVRGDEPQFDFDPKDHETLLTDGDMLDFERGAKVVGSNHYFLKGDMVRLNRALINYGLDKATEKGFIPLETPDLAKEEVLVGAGFNPRGEEDQIYSITNTDLVLIGTAEISTLGYHANEILDLSNGPIKYVALSHCFRKEGGSYGRTSKGLYRVHQFTKVEMFVFCKPEDSEQQHKELLQLETEIADELGLHYRVIGIASADLGAPAYRKYDLEAWMAMKDGDFGEVTSTSNCLDYQARRLNIKYRKDDNSTDFVHTLNGTAVVLSRFPVAIVEQYQQKDDTVRIPDVLQPYMGGKEVLGA